MSDNVSEDEDDGEEGGACADDGSAVPRRSFPLMVLSALCTPSRPLAEGGASAAAVAAEGVAAGSDGCGFTEAALTVPPRIGVISFRLTLLESEENVPAGGRDDGPALADTVEVVESSSSSRARWKRRTAGSPLDPSSSVSCWDMLLFVVWEGGHTLARSFSFCSTRYV